MTPCSPIGHEKRALPPREGAFILSGVAHFTILLHHKKRSAVRQDFLLQKGKKSAILSHAVQVWFNGRTFASQANNAGSTPVTCPKKKDTTCVVSFFLVPHLFERKPLTGHLRAKSRRRAAAALRNAPAAQDFALICGTLWICDLKRKRAAGGGSFFHENAS